MKKLSLNSFKKLNQNFFTKDSSYVASKLLGKYLVTKFNSKITVVKIVETEAYFGADDDASHAFGGKITDRNKILYERGGFVYIYLIYGMWLCLNIVTNKKGIANSVFIRAGEPILGIEIMAERRKIETNSKKDLTRLANGPGKLCVALGINKEFYGEDICGDKIFITRGEKVEKDKIIATPRINVEYAQRTKNLPLRFIVKDSPYLSQ
jgi:DNA-3-methyladenine glycosylase